MSPYFVKEATYTEFEVRIIIGDANNLEWEKIVVLSAFQIKEISDFVKDASSP